MSPEEFIIVCPENKERLIPEKVFRQPLPDKTLVIYGQFKKHHHRRQVCDWSGLVVQVEKRS